MRFSFSDTIAGYVTNFDQETDSFGLKTTAGRAFEVKFSATTQAQIVRNLGEPYQDCTSQMRSMLAPNRYLFVYGIFYPEGGGFKYEAQSVIFLGRAEQSCGFEEQDWWLNQIKALGEFYLRSQFGQGEVNYRDYRTSLALSGGKKSDAFRQETDTISRLVYGFATTYLLTGDDCFLEAAQKGTEYLREHMRFYDLDEKVIYWYHGIDVQGVREQKIFASEFGDDYDAIPAYEQIYALTGPSQTYRLTGDPRIIHDAELTLDLFDRFFLDTKHGGYFSHIDPIMLDPCSESLGNNRAKKNWNSVGDHAPAYLINLWLATGEERYATMLEYTFDTITAHFPDYANSPFIQERFYEDWSHDTTHLWQQNRGVVGHNLKLAWNLMRIYNLKPKAAYRTLARKIAQVMPAIGYDQQRGGWYDLIERSRPDGETCYRFAFHDRKAWWQQEQGILAYLMLYIVLGDEAYLKLARESSAFYNAFFLDHDDGGVYSNVLANGIPYLVGNERLKGSHAMSGYHTFELAYLAAVYTNLLISRRPMDFYFKPKPGGFKNNILRVGPDILPPHSIHIGQVQINGETYTHFDAGGLTVKLPDTKDELNVKVRLRPNS